MADDDRTARRRHILDEVRKLAAGGFIQTSEDRPAVTSDLSIDESLILHSIGWEPVELVCGVGSRSIPAGYWGWSSGPVEAATSAYQRAFSEAAHQLQQECAGVLGHGVVGVRIEAEISKHLANVVLVGTAVAPAGVRRAPIAPFLSDLTGRDFALLHQAGWDPLGLAFGASFVFAPRRSASDALRQVNQNVELENYTMALYQAREAAMEHMQTSAEQLRADGVVAVQVAEGPLDFAHHVVGFSAWGTSVKRSPRDSTLGPPQVVLSLDDAVRSFDARSLRGG